MEVQGNFLPPPPPVTEPVVFKGSSRHQNPCDPNPGTFGKTPSRSRPFSPAFRFFGTPLQRGLWAFSGPPQTMNAEDFGRVLLQLYNSFCFLQFQVQRKPRASTRRKA